MIKPHQECSLLKLLRMSIHCSHKHNYLRFLSSVHACVDSSLRTCLPCHPRERELRHHFDCSSQIRHCRSTLCQAHSLLVSKISHSGQGELQSAAHTQQVPPNMHSSSQISKTPPLSSSLQTWMHNTTRPPSHPSQQVSRLYFQTANHVKIASYTTFIQNNGNSVYCLKTRHNHIILYPQQIHDLFRSWANLYNVR